MIKKSDIFRQHHFFELLRSFDPSRGPIDLFISLYLRKHHQLGSKDRLCIIERLYSWLRWKGLIEALYPAISDPELFEVLGKDILPLSHDAQLPPHVRVSFPENLFSAFERSFGAQASDVCRWCNEPAPTTLRVNLLKTSRQELIRALQEHGIEAEADPAVATAVKLRQRANLFRLEEFMAGWFEVQDAGSQLVADLVDIMPGQSALDYCAGSGGKTLAFAPKLERTGQLFLHDIRPSALLEAKRRLRRAGVHNAQTILPTDERRLRICKGRMDWVLVDVPCSGTGTLRRNPDMKWKASESQLASLVDEQRKIVALAKSYLKPQGKLVYSTCSLLIEENEQQVAYFTQTLGMQLVRPPLRLRPEPGGPDGFFAAVLALPSGAK